MGNAPAENPPPVLLDLIRLGRLHYLALGVVIYIYGVLVARALGASVDLWQAVLGYLVMMPAHLSVSYSNEAFDIEADQHAQPGPLSGGTGVLVRRPELRSAAIGIAAGLIVLSLALGLWFTLRYQAGPLFAALVIAGNFLSWFYTAPPVRLAYRGLGEVSTATTVGLVVPLFGYVSVGAQLSPVLLLLAPLSVAYALLFVFCYQLPDRDGDRAAGKPNWTAGRSIPGSYRVMLLLTGAAVAWFVGLALAFGPLGLTPPAQLPWLAYAVASGLPLLATLLGAGQLRGKDDSGHAAVVAGSTPMILTSVFAVMVILVVTIARGT